MSDETVDVVDEETGEVLEQERTFDEAFAEFVEQDLFQYDLDQHSRLAGMVAESSEIPFGQRVRLLLDIREDERQTVNRIEYRQKKKAAREGGGGARAVTARPRR